VQSGEIEIFYEKTHIVIDKKFKNEYFGEIGFFSGKGRSASAKSVSFTNLFYLQRAMFLEQLAEFPLDHV
jgi:CRP-like cAMP-binding protein